MGSDLVVCGMWSTGRDSGRDSRDRRRKVWLLRWSCEEW